jgi:phosphatidylglycerophosphatase C
VTPAADRPTVAAFDFDGTLSTRDNFVPFLRRVAGTAAVTRSMAVNSGRVAARPRSQRSRDALKALVLHDLFAGYDAAALDEVGRGYAREIVQRHLRSEMVERADWHRTQSHVLVIVSASLGVYLRPVADQLRFDHVLCTELEVGADGRLTGAMRGANVRGLEKARRLDALFAGPPFTHGAGQRPYVWAYGDSSGDKYLWAHADHPVRVGKRRRGRR